MVYISQDIHNKTATTTNRRWKKTTTLHDRKQKTNSPPSDKLRYGNWDGTRSLENLQRPFASCDDEHAIHLIQGDPHLLQWYRHKVVDINRARGQLPLAVGRYELTDEVWTHGEFCEKQEVTRSVNKLRDSIIRIRVGKDRRTLLGEVEEKGEVLSVGHPGTFYSELIEEGMTHSFHRTQSGLRRVFEQFGDQVDRLWGCSGSENLKRQKQKEQRRALSMSIQKKFQAVTERRNVLWRMDGA